MLTPYEGVPGVRALFALAEEELGFDLWTLCQTGPQERLNDTAVSQPAVLLTSLAAALKLLHDEVRSVGPVIPVGRSVGSVRSVVLLSSHRTASTWRSSVRVLARNADDAPSLDSRAREAQRRRQRRRRPQLLSRRSGSQLGSQTDAVVCLCCVTRRLPAAATHRFAPASRPRDGCATAARDRRGGARVRGLLARRVHGPRLRRRARRARRAAPYQGARGRDGRRRRARAERHDDGDRARR